MFQIFQKWPVYLLTILICFSSCADKKHRITVENALKTVFSDDFLIGTALGAEHFQEKNPAATTLIDREFNAITPENVMKCEVIHPGPGRYDFTLADQYVAFGEKHHMAVFGHTLIWHSQLSPFVQQIKSRDSLLLFMQDHIKTVAGRYAGKIKGWDVVNEALNEDGSLRKSIFYDLLGEDYIVTAFRLAQQADPNAELYYNDYNIEQPAKRKGAIALIKKLRQNGVRIDGVGIQGHWNLTGPPVEEIEKSIEEYAALGIKVMFTELDITVLPNPWDLKGADVSQNYEGSPFMNPYPNGLPDSVQTQLADRYAAIFKVLLKHQKDISRVTFWGVNDGHSWLNGWPIKNRTNYPLLFDRQFRPKPAYFSVRGLKVKEP